MMITLNHTSPEAEITPKATGLFDEFIFFTDGVYQMATGAVNVFNTAVDEGQIIAATSLWYHDNWEVARPFINELMERLDIDEDDAMALLDESLSIYDMDIDVEPEDMADESWNIQRLTAKCAKAMGYIGVLVEDEQGSAYMLDAFQIEIKKGEGND